MTANPIRVLCYALKGRLGTTRFSSNWVSKEPGVIRSVPLDQAKKSGAFSKDHEAFLVRGYPTLWRDPRVSPKWLACSQLARRLPKAAIAAGLTRALTMNSFRADSVEIAARSSLESTPMPIEDV